MRELFTTPRYKEVCDVMNILDKNNIEYCMRGEQREYGNRYCVYVEDEMLERAAILVDEGLLEIENGGNNE